MPSVLKPSSSIASKDMEENMELNEGDEENVVRYEFYFTKQLDENLVCQLKHQATQSIEAEEFKLNLKLNSKHNVIHGSHKFDHNIEEEWLIVYILYQLSKLDHDLVIRVHDNDGEILLIEAAEHLPRWLESSKSKNRVFIHKGKLHVIPEQVDLKTLSRHEAAQVVRDTKVKTVASSPIQNAIEEQLSGLPNKKAWLTKKFKQLDEIISEDKKSEGMEIKAFARDRLSIASVMAMDDEFLRISPLSSLSSSPT